MSERRRELGMNDDDCVEEMIRRKFRNCVTASLFEPQRSTPAWFAPPATGRQLHFAEVKSRVCMTKSPASISQSTQDNGSSSTPFSR